MRVSDDLSAASVYIDTEDLEKHLIPSLEGIGNVPLIARRGSPQMCIAREYNDIINGASTRFVLLAHPDVEFSNDLLQNVESVYDPVQIGAIGILGRCADGEYCCADDDCWHGIGAYAYKEVSTLDSCFVLIDKHHGNRFDEKTFAGLHCYVEDYCCQQRVKGRKVVVVSARAIRHHSTTKSVRGAAWGDYWYYRALLQAKWIGVIQDLRTT